jgi:hypothetical protein
MTDQTKFPDPSNIADPLLRAKVTYLLEKSLLQMEQQRWRARRLMAWVSLGAIMSFTICMIFFVKPTTLVSLGEVISWFYLCTTSIIGVYIGSSALTYIAAVKAKVLPANATIADVDPSVIATPFDEIEKEIMASKKPTT